MVYKLSWKSVIFGMVAIVLLAAGCSKGTTQSGLTGASAVDIETIEQPKQSHKFIITGENFKFVMDGQDNPAIEVNEGDRITIEFTSTSGFHDWVVDEFSAATQKIRAGDPLTSVEFVADKKGTFEYYCSVGSHREMGMKGKLVVR